MEAACGKKGDGRKVQRTSALTAQQDTEKSQLQVTAYGKVLLQDCREKLWCVPI